MPLSKTMPEVRANIKPHLDHDAIIAAYQSGEPIRVISERFGCCGTYPGQLAKRHGIPLRMPQDWRSEMRYAANHREKSAAKSVRFIFVSDLPR